MNDVKLKVSNVSKVFNRGHADEVAALDDVSVDFNAGEWVNIVGGNGSGKSTLL
ncbi:ATP-binding cassette domain-containing protein, partial [Candidatus Pacearchaeota archaeon]|nr:ATP-binding cassette domain-containing protein [Candidatus Pacearchaeota archaeon]